MKISVIIPTYNRSEILMKSLRAFEQQTLASGDFEILVVSDGSTDDTSQKVKEFARNSRLNIRFLDLPHIGLPAVRNAGIKKAKGEIIVFMNDDTMPAHPDFLSQHLAYVTPETACIGFVEWHPELQKTEVMDYLSPSGPLLNFSNIYNPDDCGWHFFLTGNISLYKKWFEKELFDERHPLGNEDIELGYRLSKCGLRITYAPEIIAYHHHYFTDFEAYLESKKKRVDSYQYMMSKHPEMRKPLYRRIARRHLHKFVHVAYKMTGLKSLRNFWWTCRIANVLEQKS